ncbi:MAG TPA: hypothetical protein VGM77_06995 [Gemmatimonadales bacterium]|jgi:hypothetical protein
MISLACTTSNAIIGSAMLMLTPVCGTVGAQSAATHDSAGVRIVHNAVSTPAPAIWRIVDPTPLAILGGKAAKGKTALDGVDGAVRLSDGSIVLSDRGHSRLTFYDPHGAFRFAVDVVGPGEQRAFAEALMPVGPNEMAQWDGVSNRLTILNAKGRAVRLRHIENPPWRAERGGHWRPFIDMIGMFAGGDLLGTVHGLYSTPERQTASDSVIAYHVLATGKLDTLGKFLRGERFGFAKHFEVGGQLPLGRNGSFAVGSDAWYYTDGASYAIQERTPSGHLTADVRLDRARQPVTAAVIAHLSRARLQRSDPELRMDDSLALLWMAFPKSIPAYTALQVDAEHRVWARAWSFDDEPARWDVFDPAGHFLGAIDVPPDLDVLQIGADYLLARYTFDPSVDEVRLYRVHPAGP